MTQNNLFSRLELVWWAFTLVVLVGVLYPIYTQVPNYPFYLFNIVFIISFITLARYLFLLRFTFLEKRQTLKVAVIFLMVPLIFYLVEGLNIIQTYIDEHRMDAILAHLSASQRTSMGNYIRSELLLFGVGAVISAGILPFRLVVSIWQRHNKRKA